MSKVWKTSDDGKISYMSLTSDNIDGALDVMRNAFFLHENVCKAVELPEHPEAMEELVELIMQAARDGVSIVAVENSTGLVIGASFNKIQIRDNPGGPYFEQYARSCKYSSSRAVVEFMIEADAACDLFEHCKVDCLMEIMFLGTLPEHRGKGIAGKICEVGVEIASRLKNGENVRLDLDGTPIGLGPVPKVVSAIFTTVASQRIGRKLGFERAIEIGYEKFSYRGRTYAERLGPETPSTTLDFYRL